MSVLGPYFAYYTLKLGAFKHIQAYPRHAWLRPSCLTMLELASTWSGSRYPARLEPRDLNRLPQRVTSRPLLQLRCTHQLQTSMHDTRPPYIDFASGARRGYLSITEGHIYAIPRGAYIDPPTNKDGQTDRALLDVLLPERIASHAGLIEPPRCAPKGCPERCMTSGSLPCRDIPIQPLRTQIIMRSKAVLDSRASLAAGNTRGGS
jgi:hypothetical protein